jgi:hypothetical protein
VSNPGSNTENDTTTVLSPAAAPGGDVMDESLVYQSDGVTQAKRERVDIGWQASDPQERLVAADFPLPVNDREAKDYLRQIAEDVREIRDAFLGWIDG